MVSQDRYYLLILHYALLELRASDPELETPAARLANLLHQIPLKLCQPIGERDFVELDEILSSKAQVHDMESFLRNIQGAARSHLALMERRGP